MIYIIHTIENFIGTYTFLCRVLYYGHLSIPTQLIKFVVEESAKQVTKRGTPADLYSYILPYYIILFSSSSSLCNILLLLLLLFQRGCANDSDCSMGANKKSERDGARIIYTCTHRVAIAGRPVLPSTVPPADGPFCAPTRQKIDGVPVGHHRRARRRSTANAAYTRIYIAVSRISSPPPPPPRPKRTSHFALHISYRAVHTPGEMCARRPRRELNKKNIAKPSAILSSYTISPNGGINATF